MAIDAVSPTRRLVLGLLILLVLAPAVAGGSRAAEPLKVAVIEAPPFGMPGPDGKPTGAAVDMAVALGQRSGIAMEAILMPRARIQDAMADAQVDLAGMVGSPAADAIGHRLAPMQPLFTVVLSRPDAAVADVRGLEGKTLATLRSANYDPRLADNAAIRKQEVSSYANAINLLMAGRVDAVVGPDMGLYFEASKMGLPRASFAPPLVMNRLEVWLYLSKASAAATLLEPLKKAAEALVAEGFVESSMKAYVR